MFFKTCASSEAGRKYQVMKDPKELQALFKENKVDLSKPFIAMCGTGMYPLNIMLNFACRVVLLFFLKILFQEWHQCQTVWVQIRSEVLSGMIWVQTVCKGMVWVLKSRAVLMRHTIYMGKSIRIQRVKQAI